MSLTKRDSWDGCGGPEPDEGYEQWSDSLPPLSEDDLRAWAEQEGEDADA